MKPVKPNSPLRTAGAWVLLILFCAGVLWELQYISANQKDFYRAWFAFWGETPKRAERGEKYVIVDSRPEDRTRASDNNVSIGSSVTSPAEHAFQGPTSDEQLEEARKKAAPAASP